MRELDRLDRTHGLGTMPGAASRGRVRNRHGTPAISGMVAVGVLLVGGWILRPDVQFLGLLRNSGIAEDRYGDPPDFTPGTGTYAFAQTQRDGAEPVGYDPCTPVEYVVNPENAPAEWRELVETAVNHTEWATGLDFSYDGESALRPFNSRQTNSFVGPGQPVVIGFGDGEEFKELAGDAAGLGGSVTFSDTFGRRNYETGSIVLDLDVFTKHQVNGSVLQSIVDHEFGHLVGLDHVDSTEELMHATTSTRRTYGDGDLEGLARLGSIPCR